MVHMAAPYSWLPWLILVGGTAPTPAEPPWRHAGVSVSFDGLSKQFVLKNHGGRDAWFLGFGASYPLFEVQRLTPDGWITTGGVGCATRSARYRLDGELRFSPPLGVSRGLLGHYGEKYPNLDTLDVAPSVRNPPVAYCVQCWPSGGGRSNT